ncbi:hypothetical protein [Gracilibacillus boraciitolerans]|nr:hypothetical protein [Gracilibacillus boraciitolerans]
MVFFTKLAEEHRPPGKRSGQAAAAVTPNINFKITIQLIRNIN